MRRHNDNDDEDGRCRRHGCQTGNRGQYRDLANVFTKSKQIEEAIQRNNLWFLRSLALSQGGLLNGTCATNNKTCHQTLFLWIFDSLLIL
jgi:hypothetical protein